MGRSTGVTRRLVATLALSAALRMLSAGSGSAAASSSPVVPGSSLVAGRSYGQWVAAAWRWRASLPAVTANKGDCFTRSQPRSVWFLAGSAYRGQAPRLITRTCNIPTGRHIVLFTPGDDCSTAELAPYHATTNTGLERCAKKVWESRHFYVELSLDGMALTGYVGGTPVFRFKMPARNNWLLAPGRTHGRMAVYGFAAILLPLSRGTHTLVETVDGYTDTYQITAG